MRLFTAVMVTSFLILSVEAKADWEYSKWGMSPSQLVLASKGKASIKRQVNSIGAVSQVEAIQDVAGVRVTIRYFFERNKLIRFEGSAKASDCPAIAKAFSAKYGKPQQYGSPSGPYSRQWNNGGDDLNLQIDGTQCVIDQTDQSNE